MNRLSDMEALLVEAGVRFHDDLGYPPDCTLDLIREAWAECRIEAICRYSKLIPCKSNPKMAKIVHNVKQRNWFEEMDERYGDGK